MRLSDARHGQQIVIVATVLEHKDGGQVMLAVPGLGKTGRWSAPSTIICSPLAGNGHGEEETV